jgi:hypothetical protein
MTSVVAAIRKLGIEEKDIATSAVSLNPVWDYSNSGAAPRIRGYQLNNIVTVTVRDLDVLGDVLDDGVVAGATSVEGITFDVADRTAAEAKAREAAVADAKAKAETLASGVGVRVTGVASMSESVSTRSGTTVPAALGGRGRRVHPGPRRHDRRHDLRLGGFRRVFAGHLQITAAPTSRPAPGVRPDPAATAAATDTTSAPAARPRRARVHGRPRTWPNTDVARANRPDAGRTWPPTDPLRQDWASEVTASPSERRPRRAHRNLATWPVEWRGRPPHHWLRAGLLLVGPRRGVLTKAP